MIHSLVWPIRSKLLLDAHWPLSEKKEEGKDMFKVVETAQAAERKAHRERNKQARDTCKS